jgi:hypothetical protein
MQVTLVHFSPTRKSSVFECHKLFKGSRENAEGHEKSGRSKPQRNDENVLKERNLAQSIGV